MDALPVLAIRARACLDSFNEACVLLSKADIAIKRKISPWNLNDELGRFRLWCANSAAHRQGRSSLDFKLREASHIADRVIELLNNLDTVIKEAVELITNKRIPWEDESDSDSDSLDDLPQLGNENEDAPSTELQQLVSSTAEIITCLMRLSMAIRNPAPHNQFKESQNIDTTHFEVFDVEHVRGKFPKAEDFIVERLGKAISRRRMYLRYRETHRKKLEMGLAPISNEPATVTEEANLTHIAPSEKIQSTVASSIPAAVKASTFEVDVGENDYYEETLSQTSYASSASDTTKLRPPPLPEQGQDGDPFECPLCFRFTSVRQVSAWHKHVYRDLQPYVCTFENCKLPDSTYESRHDWFNHELHIHRKQWECMEGCNRFFSSLSEFHDHFSNLHPELYSRDRINDVVRTCERTASMNSNADCALCKQCISLTQLRRHMGKHLEELALFAIPSYMNEDEDENDKDENESHSLPSTASRGRSESPDQIPLVDSIDNQDMEDLADTVNTETQEKEQEPFWVPQATPEGRIFYLNTLTGVSALKPPLPVQSAVVRFTSETVRTTTARLEFSSHFQWLFDMESDTRWELHPTKIEKGVWEAAEGRRPSIARGQINLTAGIVEWSGAEHVRDIHEETLKIQCGSDKANTIYRTIMELLANRTSKDTNQLQKEDEYVQTDLPRQGNHLETLQSEYREQSSEVIPPGSAAVTSPKIRIQYTSYDVAVSGLPGLDGGDPYRAALIHSGGDYLRFEPLFRRAYDVSFKEIEQCWYRLPNRLSLGVTFGGQTTSGRNVEISFVGVEPEEDMREVRNIISSKRKSILVQEIPVTIPAQAPTDPDQKYYQVIIPGIWNTNISRSHAVLQCFENGFQLQPSNEGQVGSHWELPLRKLRIFQRSASNKIKIDGTAMCQDLLRNHETICHVDSEMEILGETPEDDVYDIVEWFSSRVPQLGESVGNTINADDENPVIDPPVFQPRPILCGCSLPFSGPTAQEDFMQHLLEDTCVSSPDQQYSCPYEGCVDNYTTARDIVVHMGNVHTDWPNAVGEIKGEASTKSQPPNPGSNMFNIFGSFQARVAINTTNGIDKDEIGVVGCYQDSIRITLSSKKPLSIFYATISNFDILNNDNGVYLAGGISDEIPNRPPVFGGLRIEFIDLEPDIHIKRFIELVHAGLARAQHKLQESREQTVAVSPKAKEEPPQSTATQVPTKRYDVSVTITSNDVPGAPPIRERAILVFRKYSIRLDLRNDRYLDVYLSHIRMCSEVSQKSFKIKYVKKSPQKTDAMIDILFDRDNGDEDAMEVWSYVFGNFKTRSAESRGSDSGGEDSGQHQLSDTQGHETDKKEQALDTNVDVMSWTPAHVAQYLEKIGVEKQHCEVFEQQEIDGETLLNMDQGTMFLKDFELGPLGRRLRTWQKIKRFQQEVKGESATVRATI